MHGVSRRKEGTAWGEGGYCLGRGRVLPGERESTAWGEGGYCLGRGRVLPGEREGTAWGEGEYCLGRGRVLPGVRDSCPHFLQCSHFFPHVLLSRPSTRCEMLEQVWVVSRFSGPFTGDVP